MTKNLQPSRPLFFKYIFFYILRGTQNQYRRSFTAGTKGEDERFLPVGLGDPRRHDIVRHPTYRQNVPHFSAQCKGEKKMLYIYIYNMQGG